MSELGPVLPRAPEPFVARLTTLRELAPNVRELGFERTDGAPLSFRAGQWVNLLMPIAAPPLKRSYSIARAPDPRQPFRIAVTRIDGGPGSTYLHDLSLGAELEVHGPSGFFTRDNTDPALFIGTGTGIAPLLSMLEDGLRGAQPSAPLRLLLGVRRPEDRLYRDELEALQREHRNFSADYTLSQAPESWGGKRGYVQTHLARELEELTARAEGRPVHVYICGLSPMVKSVRELLRQQLELPRAQVHSERYD